MSACTHDNIWRRKLRCFYMCSNIVSRNFFHIFVRGSNRSYSSYNLLLSSISNSDNCCHCCVIFSHFFCLFHIISTCFWEKHSVSDTNDTNIVLISIFCNIENSFFKQPKKILYFFRGSFFNIIIRKCPKTRKWYPKIFGLSDDFFCILITSPMSFKCGKSSLFCPSPISIHYVCYMLHEYFLKKRPSA